MSKPCVIQVSGEGREKFERSVELAMSLGDYDDEPVRHRPVEGYMYVHHVNETELKPVEKFVPGSYLCLLDFMPDKKPDYMHTLPFEMDRSDVSAFLWAYVNQSRYADEEPDTDGSNHLGWTVCNADNLHLYHDVGVLIIARPEWITYGK